MSELAANESAKAEKSAMAQRFRGFYPVVIDVECGGFNAQTDAILKELGFDSSTIERLRAAKAI